MATIGTDEFIFVYGSLRRAAKHNKHVLLAGAGYVADAYAQGKLYAIDSYPGFVESDCDVDRVAGELYRIVDAALLARLDDYEECGAGYAEPHEYVRKLLPIQLADGRRLSAWVYVYNRATPPSRQILSGDYVSWQQGR